MRMDPAKVKREAEIRAKLPGDVVAMVDAVRAGDTIAAFDDGVLARMRNLYPADFQAWSWVRGVLVESKVRPIGEWDRHAKPVGVDGDGKQGRPVEWNDPVPWPEPVDGAALLDDIKRLVEHYASLPAGGAVAVVLWVLHTWAFEAFGVSPNLMITAPERESGKTRVTELLSWMVRRPKPVSDASAAAIIRGIERDRPTLLFDEAQSFLKRKADDPIRGVLLASFARRFAVVERVEGESNEVRAFSTFAPKAMNGRNLARVDDMLTSRSIVLAMTRAPRRLPELRADRDPVGEELRRRCARWANDNAPALRDADPDMGERMGRSAQVWRPMFAIAHEAGGDWPAHACSAADLLEASAAKVAHGGDTLGVMLLADVREVFGTRDRIKSEDLDQALLDLPERPWATLRRGDKPMTAQARGRMLADYGIHAATLRFADGDRKKGYQRTDFEHAWAAYLSDGGGDSNRDTVTTLECKGIPQSMNRDNGGGCHGLEDAGNATDTGIVTVSRFNRTGEPGSAPPVRVSLPKQHRGTERAGDAYRRLSRGE